VGRNGGKKGEDSRGTEKRADEVDDTPFPSQNGRGTSRWKRVAGIRTTTYAEREKENENSRGSCNWFDHRDRKEQKGKHEWSPNEKNEEYIG